MKIYEKEVKLEELENKNRAPTSSNFLFNQIVK